MNKTAIKNFAVESRKSLIAMAVTRSGLVGITADGIALATQSGQGFEVYPTHFGTETTLTGKEIQSRDRLVKEVEDKGFTQVMEEVAYTWFNRLIAIRFMEVNDYLPSRVRVLSSETAGKLEPDLVTQAPHDVDMDFTDTEVDAIYAMKDDPKRSGELFRTLFIKQCNLLGDILPQLFEKTADYTELLLDIAWDKEDGVVRQLLSVDEDDFLEAVEIVGWMYQYYNTEPKETVFANLKKNIKISKESIPAATQLFTPDWIVRYMVENSLGRIAVDKLGLDPVAMDWKYYLSEAEQTPEVTAQLKVLSDSEQFQLEELKVIDPCMGSGHILVYAFHVLMQIYESQGYTSRDAVACILEQNLYGLDIDLRAYQMAYFAVMMKARSYDRRFLGREIAPQVYCPTGYADGEEYGSLLTVDALEAMPQEPEEISFFNQDYDVQMNRWNFRRLLAQKYDVVCTNPPYMGSSGMSGKLSDFVKKEYPDSKSDMSTCFMEQALKLCNPRGYMTMINIPVWMFLSSYEKLRNNMVKQNTFTNMLHFGRGVFGSDFGSVGFVICKARISNYTGSYRRLFEKQGAVDSVAKKEEWFFEGMGKHTAQQENFEKIPGSPIAYWVSEQFFDIFAAAKPLSENCTIFEGLKTRDNERFLRLWQEVNFGKWRPYAKGGNFRRWYGNNTHVVNWGANGDEVRSFKQSSGCNFKYYNVPTITYGALTSYKFSGRFINHSMFGGGGGGITNSSDLYYLLGFVNSGVYHYIMNIISPTLNFEVGQIGKQPLILSEEKAEMISNVVSNNITLSRTDWDSFETSWDFGRHPLAPSARAKAEQEDSQFVTSRMEKFGRLSWHFENWQQECDHRFNQLKANEEELNRIFIDIYGLQDELTPEVEDKDVTVRRADLTREVKSLLSYAVGCMFGRYSLDVDGLTYAGGDWDESKYATFIPDDDNVIPITDTGYFEDDIVTRLVEFVRVVYGADTLEQNLDFIATALGNKGATSREVIRNYFLKDFYKDHVKIYQKRPIYWLFDSGKQDGFKALIYLHRYDANTPGRVRADYLHKQQSFLENAIERCDYTLLQESASPRDKATATKQKDKLIKQLAETRIYDQALAHIALQRLPLDLDDGVKVNYAKFQGIEVAKEGQKTVKIDLLGKI